MTLEEFYYVNDTTATEYTVYSKKTFKRMFDFIGTFKDPSGNEYDKFAFEQNMEFMRKYSKAEIRSFKINPNTGRLSVMVFA